MNILVTGGAGYIGSHTIVELLNHDYEVICIDNESNANQGVPERIQIITGKQIQYYKGDIRNINFLDEIWTQHKIDGVIHFAALKSVEESTNIPLEYFDVNISGWINILKFAKKYNTKNIIFSSSCTVYGNPDSLPVTENTAFGYAESPYGLTKQMGEQILERVSRSNCLLRGISLRYFNPAGAHKSVVIGEDAKKPSVNLIPVLMELALKKREYVTVNGTDYDTRDGSCIRDYIHITDLARGHVAALNYMVNAMDSTYETFNLGDGSGVTVLEAIEATESVIEHRLPVKKGDRRAGDVAAIYADTTKSNIILKWKTEYNISDIISSAYKWELKRHEQ